MSDAGKGAGFGVEYAGESRNRPFAADGIEKEAQGTFLKVKTTLSDYFRNSAGFALFLGWYYHTFFLSALGIAAEAIWCDAWVWEFVECAMAVAAIVAMLVISKWRQSFRLPLGVVSVASSGIGSAFIGVGHLEGAALSYLTAVGEVMCGIAIASSFLIWGFWLSAQDEDRAERDMLLSFGLGAVICVALLCTEGPLRVALSTVLGLAASLYAFMGPLKNDAVVNASRLQKEGKRDEKEGLRRVLPVVVVYGLLWLSFSYLRIIAAPSLTGGDVLFVPFALAFLIAGAGLGVCVMLSRYVNFTLMYRWALPLIMLSSGVLYSFQVEEGRAIAYLINFVAMFGSQAACFTAAAKYVHRGGASCHGLFAALLAADGFGVVLGSKLGSLVSEALPAGETAGVSLIVVGLVLLATMALGFGGGWLPASPSVSRCTDADARQSDGEAVQDDVKNSDSETSLYESLGTEARYLRDTFGLTKRETEVAFLLLEGRNRPYIRDELFISLHTVHTHVKNIFSKCGVHSQQELIDLVRPGSASKLQEMIVEVGSPASKDGFSR